MVTLTNALKTLEQTVVSQQAEIQNLTEHIDKLNQELEEKTDSKLSSLEKRINDMYDLREKAYATKKDIETIDKKVVKISSQSNTAVQSTQNIEKKLAHTPPYQPLEEGVKEVRADLTTMRNEILAVKETLHSLQDPIPFVSVKPPEDSASMEEVKLDENTLEERSTIPSTPVVAKPPGILERASKESSMADQNGHQTNAEQPQEQKWGDTEYQTYEESHNISPAVNQDEHHNEDQNERNSSSTEQIQLSHQQDNIQQNGQERQPLKKTLLFMDSNRAHLNSGDLWKKLSIIPCQNLDSLRSLLASTQLDDVNIVFIHTGVNDIDTVDGAEVGKDLVSIVQKLRHIHPHLKIIISEITPRKCFKDDQVVQCNQHLHQHLCNTESVTIARHSNLRNEKWSFHRDDKHFTEISISLFAANMKNALRKSLGIPSRKNGKDGSNNKEEKRGRQKRQHDKYTVQIDNNKNGRRETNKNKNNMGSKTHSKDINSFKNDLIKFLTNYKV